MLSFLPGPLRAIIAAILYIILTFGCALFILLSAAIRWLVPNQNWRRMWTKIMIGLANSWGDINRIIFWLTTRVQWDIQGLEGLSPKKSYLLIANHQSWMDIPIIQKVFGRKTPLCRYFIKKELKRVPIVSWACMALDFPFMERYNKELLAKHPELKGKDIESARKACEKFKDLPITLINFAEGTRFSIKKRDTRSSPYKNLLQPKGGGIAFALATMEDSIKEILNVTIIYSQAEPVAWDFFCGKISKVTVHIEKIPVTPDLMGDYQSDIEFRKYFQKWLNGLWQKKDAMIQTLRE